MIDAKRVLLALLVVTLLAIPVRAGRVFTLSAQADVIFSVDDNPQVGEIGVFRSNVGDFTNTFAAYPSLRLETTGPQSAAEFFYTFGVNRFETDADLNFESHQFGGRVQAQLTRRLSFNLTESFIKSPDLTTAAVLTGIRITPQGIFFDQETVSQRRDSFGNNASVSFSYALASSSELSFGVGHLVRNYQDDPTFRDFRSDQQTYSGYFRYLKKRSRSTSWDIGYSALQHDFTDFLDSRTHNVEVGLTRELAPELTLRVSAGPSYIESLDGLGNFWSYSASFSIARTIEDDQVSFNYIHRPSAGTGVGSISDSDRVTFSYLRLLSRSTTLNARVDFYDNDIRLDNPVQTSGVTGSLIFSILMNENWSVNFGASYVDQRGTSTLELDRTRFYVSLRWNMPDLWSFGR